MSVAIKKAFQPFMAVVEANLHASVADIADQLRALASTKTRGNTPGNVSTFLKDVNGNTVAILDYFFKRWMPLVGEQAVEFGTKAGSASGYNQMCKVGVSAWTKRQAEAKVANAELLTLVAEGKLAPQDIPARQAEIEETRTASADTHMGFASKADLLDYLYNNGIDMPTMEVDSEVDSEVDAYPM